VRHSTAISGRGAEEPGGPAIGGATKRAFDIIFAGLAIVVLAPLLLGIGLLLYATVSRQVIRAEKRIGLGGERFTLYSFDTVAEGGALGDSCAAAVAQSLRVTGLQRLLQLYNILRGDMSFVGSEMVAEPAANEVLLARPGMTGMHHHVPRRLRTLTTDAGLDVFYVRHWSMWLDLRIACGSLARIHAHDANRPTR
jgi:lipopolysaccharide/colanic/teichoic acid biosynthesis glycosyltransferase